jgi:hypothetical protein
VRGFERQTGSELVHCAVVENGGGGCQAGEAKLGEVLNRVGQGRVQLRLLRLRVMASTVTVRTTLEVAVIG